MAHSANAVHWQVWMALLPYVLLHGVVSDRFGLSARLAFEGTAGAHWRLRAQPEHGDLRHGSPGILLKARADRGYTQATI